MIKLNFNFNKKLQKIISINLKKKKTINLIWERKGELIS